MASFNRVNHFEIHATTPEKVIKFYADMFGWKFEKYPLPGMDYWGVITGAKGEEGAINGGLIQRMGQPAEEGSAVNAFVCTITVENLDLMMQKVVKLGGMVALPKAAIPGMAWLGYCKDNDGNIFGMIQNDTNAK